MEKVSKTVLRLAVWYAVATTLAAAMFTTGCATAEKADVQPVTSTAESSVGFTSGNPIIIVQKNNVVESGSIETMLQVLMGTGDHAESVTKLVGMSEGERDAVLNTLTKSFDSFFDTTTASNNTISVGGTAGEAAVTLGQAADLVGAVQRDTNQTPTNEVPIDVKAAIGTGNTVEDPSTTPATTPPTTPTEPAEPTSLRQNELDMIAKLRDLEMSKLREQIRMAQLQRRNQ